MFVTLFHINYIQVHHNINTYQYQTNIILVSLTFCQQQHLPMQEIVNKIVSYKVYSSPIITVTPINIELI